MKKFRYILLLFLLLIGQISIGQEITSAEYFWDVDPGVGSATPLLAEDGALDEAIEKLFDNSSVLPSPGMHTFNVRVKGLDNTWSSVFSYTVNISNAALVSRDVKVIQAEYFWDTDPGVGNATPILALDGNLDEAVEKLFDGSVSIPAAGLHQFNIRVKGVDNSWSATFSHTINVLSPTLSSRDVKVIQAEYFWDTDPGVGAGTPILALDGSLNEALELLFDGGLSFPSSGFHTFHIRVKGQDNTWSTVFSKVIDVYTPTLSSRSINLVEAEYFWDTDPGLGNATPILALDGNLDEAVEQLFSNSLSTTTGYHVFHIRVKGVDNGWSSTFRYAVEVLSNVTTSDIYPEICGGQSYTVPSGDETYTASGVYSDTLVNAAGYDSIITINLTVNATTFSTLNISSCSSYTSPSGIVISTSGVYSDTIPNAAGCDSVITINLSIQPTTFGSVSVSSCDSLISPSGTYVWYTSGTYQDTLPNSNGCDSIITVNLQINNSVSSSVNEVSCGAYFWPLSNSTYSSSGAYTVTVPSANGCDSSVTLNLTVNNGFSNTTSVNACGSYTWAVDGSTYTNSGTYTANFVGANGCDSVYTLNLTVGMPSASSTTVAACESYFWSVNGQTYTNSGTYSATLTNSLGCDSVVTLNLSIAGTTSSSETISACESYVWSANGQTYSNSGVYTTTLQSQAGCDSTVTLNLTITNVTANIFQTDNVLTSSNANGGTYEWINCSTGAPIVGETGQEFIATANGVYAVVISLNNCSDTSLCVTVDNVNLDQHFLETLSLYPNPTEGEFSVDLGELKSEVTITMRDARGRLLQSDEYQNKEVIKLLVDYPSGVYFVEITANHESAIRRLVID